PLRISFCPYKSCRPPSRLNYPPRCTPLKLLLAHEGVKKAPCCSCVEFNIRSQNLPYLSRQLCAPFSSSPPTPQPTPKLIVRVSALRRSRRRQTAHVTNHHPRARRRCHRYGRRGQAVGCRTSSTSGVS